MKKFPFFAGAALALALAGSAFAQPESPNVFHGQEGDLDFPQVTELPHEPQSVCGQTAHCWENWGAAPYASSMSEALTDAKLDKFFTDAVRAGFPAQLVPFAKNYIKTHRRTEKDLVYLVPGRHLNLMESSKEPMFDVTIGKIGVGRGEVKAAVAYEFPIEYHDKVYVLDIPLTCFNLSFWSMPASQERSQGGMELVVESPCVYVDYTPPPGTTKVLVEVAGPARLPPSKHCPVMYKQGNGHFEPFADMNCHDQNCLESPEQDARDRGRNIAQRDYGEYTDVQSVPSQIKLPFDAIKYGDTVIICVEVTGQDGQQIVYRSKSLDFRPTDVGREFQLGPFVLDQ